MVAKYCLGLLLLVIVFFSACEENETPDIPEESLTESAITPEEAWNDKEQYLGENVIVSGKLGVITRECDAGSICENGKCCTTCFESFGFKINNSNFIYVFSGYEGTRIGCAEIDCERICNPSNLENNYFVKGTLNEHSTNLQLNDVTYLSETN